MPEAPCPPLPGLLSDSAEAVQAVGAQARRGRDPHRRGQAPQKMPDGPPSRGTRLAVRSTCGSPRLRGVSPPPVPDSLLASRPAASPPPPRRASPAPDRALAARPRSAGRSLGSGVAADGAIRDGFELGLQPLDAAVPAAASDFCVCPPKGMEPVRGSAYQPVEAGRNARPLGSASGGQVPQARRRTDGGCGATERGLITTSFVRCDQR